MNLDTILADVALKIKEHPLKAARDELDAKLNSEEFKTFLKERLADALSHKLINQQRIFLPQTTDQPYDDYLLDDDFIDELYDLGEPHEAERLKQIKSSPKLKRDTKAKAVEIGYYLTKDGLKAKSKAFWHFSETPVDFKFNRQAGNNFRNALGHSSNFFHDGILAGGAIAALVNEYLFGIPAIINDVDYFYYSHLKGRIGTEQALKEYSYEHMADNNDNYEIISSVKEGRLNFIELKFYDESALSIFVSNFDLNCCCVYVHPTTLEVGFTDDFVSFINERRIEHVGDELNFTNLVRAKRKQKELQAKYYYGDTIRQLVVDELTKAFPNSFQVDYEALTLCEPIMRNKAISWQRSRKWCTDFLSAKDEVTLKEHPDLLMPYFLYDPKKKYFTPKMSLPVLDFYKKFLPKKREPKSVVSFKSICKMIKEGGEENYPGQETSTKNYEKLSFLLTHFPEQIESKYGDYNEKSILSFSPWLKNDWAEDKLLSLLERIKGHTILKKSIIKLSECGWTFGEIDSMLRQVMNLGLKETGTFEHLISSTRGYTEVDYAAGKTNYRIDWKFNREKDLIPALKDIQAKLNEFNEKQNCLRPMQGLGALSKYAKEIVMATELEAEGKKMHHCVGGYAEKVRRGNCRIFHLERNGFHSTLEVGIRNITQRKSSHRGKTPYYFIQNKAYSNAAPHESLEKVAKLLINHLYFLNEQREMPKKSNPKKSSLIAENRAFPDFHD